MDVFKMFLGGGGGGEEDRRICSLFIFLVQDLVIGSCEESSEPSGSKRGQGIS
jgi:hypothetical protein